MEFYLTALMIGLCLSMMSLGIFITMKIFKIPDITTDGSYTLGAVVTALLLPLQLNPFLVIPVTFIAGGIAGALTGIIHTKLKIDALLAGILVMTALYSINLSLLGRSNIPLINIKTIFSYFHPFNKETYDGLIMAALIVVIIVSLLAYLLKTDFGIAMRATGNSDSMTRALGINNDKMKIIGLAIANSLTAFSGYLVAQYQSFTDINMGIGIVITGLGSVLISTAIINWLGVANIWMQLLCVVIGSIIFQMVLAVTLSLGIDPNMLKLVTAIFVLLIVSIPKFLGRAAG